MMATVSQNGTSSMCCRRGTAGSCSLVLRCRFRVYAGEPQPAQFDKDQISPRAGVGRFQSPLPRLFGETITFSDFVA